ncbi:MAG: Abi family protein [Bacteroidetes bacterium]|nr:Abi family protein [Bacteroidota bacterium]
MKINYTKTPLLYSEQVQLLKSRGLNIADDSYAEACLSDISYYRLSAYFYPFLADKKNHVFKPGSDFESVIKLYRFDNEFRLLLFNAITLIEVSVRTKLTYELSHKYGAFWLENETLYRDKGKTKQLLSKLKEELGRSDEEYLEHYRNKYLEDIPPAWISLEISSFGLVSQLYMNLSSFKDKKEIARHFGFHLPVFQSFLHSLTVVRNICAHHSRIWNKVLSVQPVIPKGSIQSMVDTNKVKRDRISIIVLMMTEILSKISIANDFRKEFESLLMKYPDIDLWAMGFMENIFDKNRTI